MIHTGDCILTDSAARALKRAGARAVSKGRKFVGQEDLFVALLQSRDEDADGVIAQVPRLVALRISLAEDTETLNRLESSYAGVDVQASAPVQTCIELAAIDGVISARGLLLGLLAAPKTHLLKLIASERRDREAAR